MLFAPLGMMGVRRRFSLAADHFCATNAISILYLEEDYLHMGHNSSLQASQVIAISCNAMGGRRYY